MVHFARHLRPLRVHETASRMLQAGRLQKEPPWYRVIAAFPPTTSLVRPPPVEFKRRRRTENKKVAGRFKPQEIVYPEDRLRTRFFQDHPWELARPRILVENDGKDYRRHDWSRMQQPGKQLDGESVVQRQMWLMENEGLPQTSAYDRARKEFYDLRMKQDIERRIAREEALAVGAQFGKSYLEVGIELESKVLEGWKEKATAQLQLRKNRQAAAYTGGMEDEEETSALDGLAEPATPDAAAPTPAPA